MPTEKGLSACAVFSAVHVLTWRCASERTAVLACGATEPNEEEDEEVDDEQEDEEDEGSDDERDASEDDEEEDDEEDDDDDEQDAVEEEDEADGWGQVQKLVR